MQMDRETVIERVKNYAEQVCAVLSPIKIVLYGSYAKGNWHKDSDIDVAIFVDKIDDNYLQLLTQLNKLTRKIDMRIEPVLLAPEDDISGFLGTVNETGIVLYDSNAQALQS